MLTAFDVGLTNKRLVLDTRQDKRERAQHSAVEPHSSCAQTSDVKTGVLGVHTVAFGVFLAVYLALCVSDVLDSEPRHGTKVHMCILAGVPVCLVYQHVRTVRLRYLVMGVLLHTLALVALLGFAGGMHRTHIAADIMVVSAGFVVYYVAGRSMLSVNRCWCYAIMSTYLASLVFILAFRYTQILPLYTLLQLEAVFVILSIIVLMISSRGEPAATRL